METEFITYRKIPRLSRDVVITEKIDGTNAQLLIYVDDTGSLKMKIGKRSQWIEPQNDNFGFAKWAREHEAELLTLGPGRYYGEWWGLGIQRGYGLTEKRFSLFKQPEVPIPACVSIVPVLYVGPFNTAVIDQVTNKLRTSGSVASPGFMKPEGVVVFHTASGALFKKTLEQDEQHKGVVHGNQ